jgi:hypothetical protein
MAVQDLVAPFSQVGVMAGSANAAATQGACHNFSLQWIAAMYADSTPANADKRMTALSKGKGGAAMVTQTIFGNEWTRQSAEAADKGVAAWRGLQFVEDVLPYEGYTQAQFLDGLNTTSIAGVIYSFWFSGSVVGASGGAHTIAFFRKMKTGRLGKADNQIYSFDPNFGECLSVEGAMGSWITTLLGNYGPCQHHWMRAFSKL